MTDLVTLPTSSAVARANMLSPYRCSMSGYQGSNAGDITLIGVGEGYGLHQRLGGRG